MRYYVCEIVYNVIPVSLFMEKKRKINYMTVNVNARIYGAKSDVFK